MVPIPVNTGINGSRVLLGWMVPVTANAEMNGSRCSECYNELTVPVNTGINCFNEIEN